MNSYQKMIKRISEKLREQSLPYVDSIIIGDNASGKSDILKTIIESDDKNEIYFIDAVNRYFSVKQIMKDDCDVNFSKEISRYRISEENFNKRDTFNYNGTPKAIEEFYLTYEVELVNLMEEFLQIKFICKKNEIEWEALINEKPMTLSSGYQAILRIFLEVLYFEKTKGSGMVVIDEIDEFLSAKNSANIFNFLREKFQTIHFIVTTHSADLIANSKKANIVVLEKDTFQILDADDFSSISQTYCIFDSIFGSKDHKSEKEKLDDELRRLLNNKLSNIWDEEEKEKLDEIKGKNLTKTQKIIISQIERWSK